MPADPLAGLFKDGRIVALPSPAREAAARRLERLGLLRVEEQQVVRCVNPVDRDQRYVKDLSCTGVRRLESRLDEDDDAYRCPECSRVLYPSRKQRFARLRLWTVREAMGAWVQQTLTKKLTWPVSRAVEGLWRVDSPGGEVEVCLVDVCADQSVLHPQYSRAGMLVFIVGNDRDYRRHLPDGAPVFRLADLVETGTTSLLRVLRRLGRAKAGTPAVVAASRGLPPPPVATRPDPFPGIQTHRAPPGTRWNEVKVYEVDGLTVQLRVPGKPARSLTAAELGMVNKRSRDRAPTKKWKILMALCEGRGRCSWRQHGSFSAFKVQVSEMRPLLTHIFGIDEDPFTACTSSGGLEAAFVAGPIPEDEPYVGEDQWLGR